MKQNTRKKEREKMDPKNKVMPKHTFILFRRSSIIEEKK
jgi:hypothetical protein